MAQRRSTSKLEWNKVTWYSRMGAILLFLGVLPSISFYIGTQYELTAQTLSQADNFAAQRLGIVPVTP
jgi:hypothetical protein